MERKIEHLDYLKATKRNQVAMLTTRKSFKVNEYFKFSLIHTRYERLNCNYLKLENKRRAARGEPPLKKAGPLPWGEWEIPNILIKHNSQLYLRYYKYDGDLKHNEWHYESEGGIVRENTPEWEEIQNFINEHDKPKSFVRNVSIDRVEELSLCDKDGTPETDVIFVVEDEDDEYG